MLFLESETGCFMHTAVKKHVLVFSSKKVLKNVGIIFSRFKFVSKNQNWKSAKI